MGDGDALTLGNGRCGPLRPAVPMVRLAIGVLAVVLIGAPAVRAAEPLIRPAPRSGASDPGASGPAAAGSTGEAILLFWAGNNDTSLAALGSGLWENAF